MCCITLSYHHPVRREALEKLRQLGASILPREGAQLSVRAFFVEAQPLVDFFKTGTVVRREHLALPDRAGDGHLIAPTDMDGGMHHHQIGLGLGQPVDRRLAPVRRAVIDPPEDARRRTVGFPLQHVRDQAPERLDPCRRFTPAHDDTPTDVPGRQVLSRTTALVLVLDTQRPPGGRGQAGMTPDAGLDTGRFLGTAAVILRAKRFPWPVPSLPIQHAPGFFDQGRGAGNNPVLVLPGLDGIGIAYPPDGAGTDRFPQRPTGRRGDVRRREPTPRQRRVVDCLPRDGFDEGLVPRGKTGPSVLDPGQRPRQTPHGPSVVSHSARRGDGGAPLRLPGHSIGGDRPASVTPMGHGVAAETRPSVAAQALGLVPRNRRASEDDRLARDLA